MHIDRAVIYYENEMFVHVLLIPIYEVDYDLDFSIVQIHELNLKTMYLT